MSAHDVFTTTLRLMGAGMNRDELFDQADEIDPFDAHREWQQRLQDEREIRLENALTACKDAGVELEHLRVLAFEAGATHWALKNSLKG
jgi:hypothetical protein